MRMPKYWNEIKTVKDLQNWWGTRTEKKYPFIFTDVSNLVVTPNQYTKCLHASVPSRYVRELGRPGHRDWAFSSKEDLIEFATYYWTKYYENY